ncbi:MAG: VTT domain-containing protein [Thermoleophilia bacterium]|nr:VTT domain-containing protein [Thermoleophilia bacterium]
MTPQPLTAITLPHATAALVAVIWAALAIWRRKRLSTERKIVAVIGVALLAAFAAGAFAGIPKPEKILESVAGTLGKWTYLLVGVLAFLETGAFVGLIAPGEAAVVIGGVVAGQGEIDIGLLIGLVWIAALAGDSTSYFIGRRLGREFLVKHGARVKITEPRVEQVERYMHRYGGSTILVGRFIGLVRALAPFIAGASRLPYRRFLPYDVIGSGLWAATFCMLGYVFSQNLGAVIDYAQRGALIFGWTIGTVVAVVYLVRRFREPAERAKLSTWLDQQERDHHTRARVIRPLRRGWNLAVMPLAHWWAPKLRFTLDRFTPGGLGIEFTTSAAVAVVAGYTYYFFTSAALEWPSNALSNHVNNAAFRIADGLRTDWLDSIARAVTQLGALYVVASVVAVTVAICLYRRRIPEAAVLVLSLASSVAISQATKNWTSVPRPTNPLTSHAGWSYPSGHAAYAVSYVTVALSLERVGGIFARAALVVAALLLGGAIALSRVYLRVHYLTDAIGGTAVGFLTASLLACVAMALVHRRNRRQSDDRRAASGGERPADKVN